MHDGNSTPDYANLRYVIYARKSTEDEGRQIRSIKDQVYECKRLAESRGIEVKENDIIQEAKSAKVPGKRPLFTQMLKDIRDRKIDGIIAWQPDRLARNMIDAAAVIHLLDTDQLKDMHFYSYQFSNDANGKMMLGMLFVFAKHYSDDLSGKVNRGMRRNFAEGKSSGAPKHGYIRDDESIYRPDENSFELTRQAWMLRAEGKTLDEVAFYLNSQGYSRLVKKVGHRVLVKMDKKKLSNMFADTFYFGLLNQTGQTVDLLEAPGSFIPMIDKATFLQVQEHSRRNTRGQGKKNQVFFPGKGLIYCGVCKADKSMAIGNTTSKGRTYTYYRCDNPVCTRNKRSTKIDTLFTAIQTFIAESLGKLPEETYDQYLKELKEFSDTKLVSIRSAMKRSQVVLEGKNKSLISHSHSLASIADDRTRARIIQEMNNLTLDTEKLENQINKYKKSLERSAIPKLEPHEFWTLVQNTSKDLRKATEFQKDTILRTLFLKLYFDDKNVASAIWKEPFSSLLQMSEVSNGRGDRT
jgi:DNA invertase Pin-like site-specific DNA recombinase